CRPVIGITNSGRFRTIQIAPAAGATFLRADADSLARPRPRLLHGALSRRPTWQSRGALSVHRHPWLRAGIRTVNTEPLPGSLATVTSPPIMRASLRDRARPSPVPP